MRRLLKPDKGRPFLRACQRLPVEVAPQVGMSVRGAAVFLRVGYVRLQTRSGDVSVGSKTEVSGLARHVRFTLRSRHRQAIPACRFRACHKLTSEGDAKTGDGDAGYADPGGAQTFGQA